MCCSLIFCLSHVQFSKMDPFSFLLFFWCTTLLLTHFHFLVVGDATNIILDPILMFTFKLGVTGAAIAHVTSQ